ncbi:MAG: hypothetical protein J6Z49_06585 [Kiritimatiellae bacterium]|nr:hypothetical protein [Kiritimatiellia bacterium]
MKKWLLCFFLAVSACCPAGTPYKNVHGVYPHLATFNREGECGTGAVVPWAGSLWAVSYAPHSPHGSSDKLYEIKPDLSRLIRPESVGGTPANRMIHTESRQLFIGPYVISGTGGVRVLPFFDAAGAPYFYGRPTANARHLADPVNKVYCLTMEEGVYEIDVHSLAAKELFRDGNLQKNPGGDLLPGYHGKGAYSGQGRLVYANNGDRAKKALTDPAVPSGVLAQWRGGDAAWEVVRRNQFTDVTGPGGIRGNPNPDTDPLWTIGWDFRSLILNVLDGGVWHSYRLPKASHSYDGAHGWNTEWPRIREIGEGDDFLMTMHGSFWRFPATFDARHATGIRPRSNYLKVVGDFCRWGDRLVLGCDDSARNEFLNKRKAKGSISGPVISNSNFWFLKPAELDAFGPAIGRGAVWMQEDVPAGAVSDPFLLDGFDSRLLELAQEGAGAYLLQIDTAGDGVWRDAGTVHVAEGRLLVKDLAPLRGAWIRLVAQAAAKNVTAFFNYANRDGRSAKPDAIFDGIARPGAPVGRDGVRRGFLRSLGGGEEFKLGVLNYGGYYELDKELNLVRRGDERCSTASALRRAVPLDGEGVFRDAAGVGIVDDAGRRWRFPSAPGWNPAEARETRVCREVCTERDLLNLDGIFYELPAENAGGFAKTRAIATHGRMIHDFCSWRGLLLISGIAPNAVNAAGRLIRSEDGRCMLWAGVVDDLWAFGKPCGSGGVWKGTEVKAGEVSDPLLLTGFDRKTLTLRQTGTAKAVFTVEADITGTGVWAVYKTYTLAEGESVSDDLSAFRAYWIRVRSDASCRADVLCLFN